MLALFCEKNAKLESPYFHGLMVSGGCTMVGFHIRKKRQFKVMNTAGRMTWIKGNVQRTHAQKKEIIAHPYNGSHTSQKIPLKLRRELWKRLIHKACICWRINRYPLTCKELPNSWVSLLASSRCESSVTYTWKERLIRHNNIYELFQAFWK